MRTRISFLSGDYVGEILMDPNVGAHNTQSDSIVSESVIVVEITQTTTFKVQTNVEIENATGLQSGKSESTLFVQKLASADGGSGSSTTPKFCNVAYLNTTQTISHHNC